MTEGPGVLDEVAGTVDCSTQCIKLKQSVKKIIIQRNSLGGCHRDFSANTSFSTYLLVT